MNKNILPWMIAGALAASSALAVDSTASDKSSSDLEAQLQDARAKLEEAAHEVARLSAEVGRPMMDRLMVWGEGGPHRAIIGVQLDPASGKDGAKVKEVSPGGPAAEAGIRANDVIVMVNGTEVKGDSSRAVVDLMRKVQPESKVNLRVLRDGKPKDFIIITRPAHGVFAPPIPPPPGYPGAELDFGDDTAMAFVRRFDGEFSDMELVTLTPQLGRYFGTEEGVLVVRKPEENDALKLEEGDVILSIDGRKPTSGSHATRILRSYQPGEKISMRVMRQKKAINVDVTLPEGAGHPRTRIFRTGEDPS